MKDNEKRLNRLFQAARRAPASTEPSEIPDYLAARIMREWRSDAAEPRAGALALLLRWGLMGAAAVMLLSIAWASTGPTDDTDHDDTVANYDLREELMP